MPLEGFFYDKTAGYKGDYVCGDLPNVINYDDETHDATLVMGECSVKSLLDSFAKSGKKVPLPDAGDLKNVAIKLETTPEPTVTFKEASGEITSTVHVNMTGQYQTFSLNVGAGITVSAKLTKGTNADPVKNLVVYNVAYSIADVTDIKFGDVGIPALLQPIISALIKESVKNYKGNVNIPVPNFSFESSKVESVELQVKDGYLLGQVGMKI